MKLACRGVVGLAAFLPAVLLVAEPGRCSDLAVRGKSPPWSLPANAGDQQPTWATPKTPGVFGVAGRRSQAAADSFHSLRGGNGKQAHLGVISKGTARKAPGGNPLPGAVRWNLFMHLVADTSSTVPPDPDSTVQRSSAHRTTNLRDERQVVGWRVLISRRLLAEHAAATEKAIGLLAKQLQEIVRVVPAAAVTKLKAVPLYLSPAYEGFSAKAEYHPNAAWLRKHGRDPAMAKAVEFTNILIFEQETRRMPNFTLHELAHAYHDRELADGFGNPAVIEAFKRAEASDRYDRVQRQDANGNRSFDRAYALTNQQEYFAEVTEAYFSRNDFFPFCREELETHDPHACRLLTRLWGCQPEALNPILPAAPTGSAQGF